MGSNKSRAGARHIRRLNDALIDEDGTRWDRVRDSELYYMTAKESKLYIRIAVRYLRTEGFGSRAEDVGKLEFKALAKESPEHRVQAFRASDGSKKIVVTVDMSDC